MTLTPEQKQAVTAWVAAGDSLAVIQQKLAAQFKVSLTYMDVRFLVDDLGLELKSAAPAREATADLTAARPPQAGPGEKKGGLFDRLKQAVGGADPAAADGPEADTLEDDPADLPLEAGDDLAGTALGAAGKVKVEIDRVVRPGAVVSGGVTFSDGASGKWAMDQYGRLMLDVGRKGYKPSAEDVQTFQRELSAQLQRHGF
jgi:hypothetical protein